MDAGAGTLTVRPRLSLSTQPLNRAGASRFARNLALGTVYVQVMTVTLPLSRDGGVHLYFFTVASTLCLLFVGRRDLVMLGLAAPALAVRVLRVRGHAGQHAAAPRADPRPTSCTRAAPPARWASRCGCRSGSGSRSTRRRRR
jgi:hypothetical protein